MTIEYKQQALKQHINDSEINKIHHWRWDEFEAYGKSYHILNDEEADKACRDYIRESLWAFRPEFLINYMDFYKDQRGKESLMKFLSKAQSEMCEECNETIHMLIRDRFDKLVRVVTHADGKREYYFIYQQ